MAWGRRCDAGCETWPDSSVYDDCPVCGEPTTRFSNLEPMTEAEALEKRAELEFLEFYERHCMRQGQSVDGPLAMTPEESLTWQEKYPGGRPDNR